MVYCSKCGTLNPDNATNCSICGFPLYAAGVENRPYSRRELRHRQYEDEHDHHRRGHSGFGLLIGGVVIILVALALLFFTFSLFFLYFWPVILVLIGVWLIVRAAVLNRRYRQSSPH